MTTNTDAEPDCGSEPVARDLSIRRPLARPGGDRARRVLPALDWLCYPKGRGNMTIRAFPSIFNHAAGRPMVPRMPLCKAVAFAAGLALSMLSYPIHASPTTGGDTVQGLYDALLSTMKNGRILGQSGRFTQLEPVIRRSFDISSMT